MFAMWTSLQATLARLASHIAFVAMRSGVSAWLSRSSKGIRTFREPRGSTGVAS